MSGGVRRDAIGVIGRRVDRLNAQGGVMDSATRTLEDEDGDGDGDDDDRGGVGEPRSERMGVRRDAIGVIGRRVDRLNASGAMLSATRISEDSGAIVSALLSDDIWRT